MKRKFKECEADVAAEMRFSDSKVEFVLTGGGVSDFKGWRIEPNAEPLAVSRICLIPYMLDVCLDFLNVINYMHTCIMYIYMLAGTNSVLI